MDSAVSDSLPEESIINRQLLLELFDGDLAFVHEISDLFFEDCPRRFAELRAALARDDRETLARTTHSLKGSIGNFAAPEVLASALRLESAAQRGDRAQITAACAQLEEQLTRLRTALDALR